MSDTKKYLSLERLQQYNELLKDKIAEDDALVLETAKEYVDGQIESHVHSWNDLEDKPTEISGGYTFENTGSASSNFGFTKVSDIVLTLEDFANGYTVTLETGEVKEYTADDIIVGSYMMLSNDNLIRCKDEYIFSLPEPFKLPNGTTLTAGTYFHTPSTTHTVTIRGKETLKEGFIPESIARTEDLIHALATASEAKDKASSALSAAERAQDTADEAKASARAAHAKIGTIPSSAATVIEYINSRTGTIENDLSGIRLNVDSISDRVSKNETDIANITADYLKAADKTELEGKIDTVAGAVERLTNGVSADEVDGVNDLIQYVKDHGTEVTGMQEDISDNADAIAGVAGRMDTAEGKITAVEGAVATKAEKTYVDEQVQALQSVDTGLDNRLKAVEAAVGESGSVADDIATAKQEAIDAAAADATSKANTAESNAKGHADSLNTAMNTRVEALEAIDHDHANKAELDLIATGDKAKWDAAAGKAHEHSNLAVLEGITAAKITAWDAAEGNAKTYADGLNTAMDTRVATLESWHENFVECSQEDIQALFA